MGKSDLAIGVGIAVVAAVGSRVAFGEVPEDSPANRVKENVEELAREDYAPGDNAIETTNRLLQANYSTEADTEVSETLSGDLAEPGGAISTVDDEDVMGGGNPETSDPVDDSSDGTKTDPYETGDIDVDVGDIDADIGSSGGLVSGGGIGGIDP